MGLVSELEWPPAVAMHISPSTPSIPFVTSPACASACTRPSPVFKPVPLWTDASRSFADLAAHAASSACSRSVRDSRLAVDGIALPSALVLCEGAFIASPACAGLWAGITGTPTCVHAARCSLAKVGTPFADEDVAPHPPVMRWKTRMQPLHDRCQRRYHYMQLQRVRHYSQRQR